MKSKTKKNKNIRKRAGRTTAKGREIIASLTEALDVERSGVPLGSRFAVRTVELPGKS